MESSPRRSGVLRPADGGRSLPRATGSPFIKSTFLPLCGLVIFFCIYLPNSSNFASTRVGPNPEGQRFVFLNNSKDGAVSKSEITREISSSVNRHVYSAPSVAEQAAHDADTPTTQSNNSTATSASTPTPTVSRDDACEPIKKLVYVKTHKTGSTTLASILERFGYLRNLDFALGKRGHIISNEGLFNPSQLVKIPNRSRQDFDMLVNHVRYSRREMDAAIHDAKYISIIRNPVTQLESAFGYFEMGKHLNITTPNPFQTFLSDPRKYYAMKKYFWTRSRNGMLYDFGFSHKDDENVTSIKHKIEELSKEMDLMLITEYFDESLILLRKLMCWDFDDILYISNGIRSKSHRFPLTDTMAEQIREWSAADLMLYDHFNKTLWQRIANYGPSFQEDLAHFRHLERTAFDECIDTHKNNTGDRREEKLTLKTTSKKCEDLMRADVQYAALIRKTMILRVAHEAATKPK